ncbi:uncharacterized protein HGUI_00748 [Hanseniaspora guilliermondii]|uniref:Roadblock/LAMTOR2 domain-containing protein n=1 Tax=Hanseniaspora guilliermondii TaxID=56406 RepID=A0A1L0AYC8_9ASCO|nr:uncharacterized protein HGUI_00748 [Hanseniaspora guilliermondii]
MSTPTIINAKALHTVFKESIKQHKYYNNSKNLNGIMLLTKTGTLLFNTFDDSKTVSNDILNFISLLIASNYSQEEIVIEKINDKLIGIQSYEINLNLNSNNQQLLYNMCCCNIPDSDLILVYLSKIDQLELGALKMIITTDIDLYTSLYGYKV